MKRPKISPNILLLSALTIAILLMGIGYASIESITGEIEGTVMAKAQEGVFITNIEYLSDIDANENASKIEYYTGTTMKSTVELSKTNINSQIKYKVTVYNNSEESVPFNGVVYDNDFYDNSEIVFDISGFEIGQTIEPGETKEIIITFRYRDNIENVPEKTVLKSYLNFKMSERNRMVAVKEVSSTNYLTSTVSKDKIEYIKFERGKEPTNIEIISRFDASEKQDESIVGYYTDADKNGLYELTFVSEEVIYSPIYPSWLFYKLTQVKSIEFDNFSTCGAREMRDMFRELNLSGFDTSQVTNVQGMFCLCSSLIELDIKNFNTTNIKNMYQMFFGCSSFTLLDVSGFNTSNVTNMGAMFQGCKELTKLDVRNFDTSKSIGLNSMFSECSKILELDLSNFNTSNAEDMAYMFSGCNSLEKLDLNNFDTRNVRNMANMFVNCRSLIELNLSNFSTNNVTDMLGMFNLCTNLIKLNISNFNTQKVKRMSYMFQACRKIEKIEIKNFDVSNVEEMKYMFNSCNKMVEVDLSGFNTINVNNMQSMFNECYNLQKVYVKKFNENDNSGWTTRGVTDSTDMFLKCTKLTGGNGTAYNEENTDATYARIDTEETPGYFTNIKDKSTETT